MKKILLIAAMIVLSNLTHAQDQGFKSFQGSMSDISLQSITKEELFKHMDRSTIKLGQSICSNRALMWLADLKRDHNIDGGKIFLFYTNKTGSTGLKTWWYHVSPMIVEKGQEWVMDGGFSSIKTPLRPTEWINQFIGSPVCREITTNDHDLIDLMFRGHTFPENYRGEKNDCYFIKAPAGYWTPSSVAMHLLGVDGKGSPVNFIRNSINKNEVYSACREAVTGPVGGVFGAGKKKCEKYLN
jgi:hypothetical protein